MNGEIFLFFFLLLSVISRNEHSHEKCRVEYIMYYTSSDRMKKWSLLQGTVERMEPRKGELQKALYECGLSLNFTLLDLMLFRITKTLKTEHIDHCQSSRLASGWHVPKTNSNKTKNSFWEQSLYWNYHLQKLGRTWSFNWTKSIACQKKKKKSTFYVGLNKTQTLIAYPMYNQTYMKYKEQENLNFLEKISQ